jgi:hypothetical protein
MPRMWGLGAGCQTSSVPWFPEIESAEASLQESRPESIGFFEGISGQDAEILTIPSESKNDNGMF